MTFQEQQQPAITIDPVIMTMPPLTYTEIDGAILSHTRKKLFEQQSDEQDQNNNNVHRKELKNLLADLKGTDVDHEVQHAVTKALKEAEVERRREQRRQRQAERIIAETAPKWRLREEDGVWVKVPSSLISKEPGQQRVVASKCFTPHYYIAPPKQQPNPARKLEEQDDDGKDEQLCNPSRSPKIADTATEYLTFTWSAKEYQEIGADKLGNALQPVCNKATDSISTSSLPSFYTFDEPTTRLLFRLVATYGTCNFAAVVDRLPPLHTRTTTTPTTASSSTSEGTTSRPATTGTPAARNNENKTSKDDKSHVSPPPPINTEQHQRWCLPIEAEFRYYAVARALLLHRLNRVDAALEATEQQRQKLQEEEIGDDVLAQKVKEEEEEVENKKKRPRGKTSQSASTRKTGRKESTSCASEKVDTNTIDQDIPEQQLRESRDKKLRESLLALGWLRHILVRHPLLAHLEKCKVAASSSTANKSHTTDQPQPSTAAAGTPAVYMLDFAEAKKHMDQFTAAVNTRAGTDVVKLERTQKMRGVLTEAKAASETAKAEIDSFDSLINEADQWSVRSLRQSFFSRSYGPQAGLPMQAYSARDRCLLLDLPRSIPKQHRDVEDILEHTLEDFLTDAIDPDVYKLVDDVRALVGSNNLLIEGVRKRKRVLKAVVEASANLGSFNVENL